MKTYKKHSELDRSRHRVKQTDRTIEKAIGTHSDVSKRRIENSSTVKGLSQ